MHRQIPHSLDQNKKKIVDKKQSYQLLQFGNTKGETESTTVSAKKQVLSTNCFVKKF
jgi:hypothetical protein